MCEITATGTLSGRRMLVSVPYAGPMNGRQPSDRNGKPEAALWRGLKGDLLSAACSATG